MVFFFLVFERVLRQFALAVVSDKVLELFGAARFDFDDLLSFTVDLIISIELLLELDNFLISLVKTGG